MLSCLSSLQGHSDFPTPVARILPVSLDLERAYHARSSMETLGSQVLPPLSFTACRWPYPGSPSSASTLYFPDGSGLLPITKGSACIPPKADLSLNRTLPAMSVQSSFTKLRFGMLTALSYVEGHHSLYATACGFGRHP